MIIDASHFGPVRLQILVRLSTAFKRSFMLWMSNCSLTISLYLLPASWLIINSLLPHRRSILWRCSLVIDRVDASVIQALWSPGLLMNGSIQKFVTSMSGDLYPAPMCIFQLIYVLGGTSPQYLWDNSMSPTPLASNIFLSFPSIVCLLLSMITISLSPSFLHVPHCAAKSLLNRCFDPVSMCLFWQYLFNCL